MKPVGIAITTFNRGKMIIRLLEAIRRLTTTSFQVVVCNDGSTDNTIEVLRQLNIPVITGLNRGVAWNKNRGLFYFMNFTDCDPIILLDDDVMPTASGWEVVWRQAAELLGHANSALANSTIIWGMSTPENPGLATIIPGHTMVFSRYVLNFLGYMDTRFGRYGHEHTDFSFRSLRSGYGGYYWPKPKLMYLFYVINSDLVLESAFSSVNRESVERNASLLWKLEKDSIYRLPWRTDEEMAEFKNELLTSLGKRVSSSSQAPADFDTVNYLDRYPDVRQAGVDPFSHYARYGYREGRSCTALPLDSETNTRPASDGEA